MKIKRCKWVDLLCLMKANVHKPLIYNAKRFGIVDVSIDVSKNVMFTLDLNFRSQHP